jgi:hypothetical protein
MRERIDGRLLGAGSTIVHAVTLGLVATSIELRFTNIDTSTHQITLWFVPQGESSGDDFIESRMTLNPGTSRFVKWEQAFLRQGDSIEVAPSTGGAITVSGGVLEESA